MIFTKSKFYYIAAATDERYTFNFDEGSGELKAEVQLGSWSMQELAEKLEAALNGAGTQDYTVTLDRDERLYSISAASNFEILGATGTDTGFGIMATMGFTTDQSGSNSYQSDVAAGTSYQPQFELQDFVDFNDNKESIGASVNESASGIIEVISFGSKRFMECNIKYITDLSRLKGSPIENNNNALQEARDFMDFCITKGNLEFIPNAELSGEYDIVLLESSTSGKNGTAYKLRELISQRLAGYYETGVLKFRKID